MSDLDTLRHLLHQLPPGEVSGSDAVRAALADAWSSLAGNRTEGTDASKLVRMEELRWEPPCLVFRLERHGGTVNGISRAEVHEWRVDVERGAASVHVVGHRQLRRMQPRLDTEAIARRIASKVKAGDEDRGSSGRKTAAASAWRSAATPS